MNWPQYTMASWLVLTFIFQFVAWVKDDSLSSTSVSLRVVMYLVLAGLEVAILHAGGFW